MKRAALASFRTELGLAAADAEAAAFEFDDAREWLADAGAEFAEPLAVEVWVFDAGLSEVLLVRHRWRGWVPPGGRVEPGEAPRAAAVRELAEETSLRVALLDLPAAVAVRSYHPKWPETLGLSYFAIVDGVVDVRGEKDQPVAWHRLTDHWDSSFPDDRSRMNAFVKRLRQPSSPVRRTMTEYRPPPGGSDAATSAR